MMPFSTERQPYWPTTEPEFALFDQVANAALAEVGLGEKFRLSMQDDGTVWCDPPSGDTPDVLHVDRAVALGWETARRLLA